MIVISIVIKNQFNILGNLIDNVKEFLLKIVYTRDGVALERVKELYPYISMVCCLLPYLYYREYTRIRSRNSLLIRLELWAIYLKVFVFSVGGNLSKASERVIDKESNSRAIIWKLVIF